MSKDVLTAAQETGLASAKAFSNSIKKIIMTYHLPEEKVFKIALEEYKRSMSAFAKERGLPFTSKKK